MVKLIAATIGIPAGVLVALVSATYAQNTSVTLVQEGFEDANVASRGWYDTSGVPLSTAERYAGATSLQCRFTVGGTTCTGGTVGRHRFQDTDSVHISFYIKHSSNWVGSGTPYGPHKFHLVTNMDSAYVGPAFTHLTTYIEESRGIPLLSIQDGKNIDQTKIGQDLTAVTEARAVAGCNGDSDGYGNGSCYLNGSLHWNVKQWLAGSVFFDSTPGSPTYKATWHLVEAYFKLNSIVNGKGARDGIVRYWYDGNLIIDHPNVVLRTGANATMKFNQFLIAPYMGGGSPADQSFWMDNLVIATDRPSPPPAPPNMTTSAPAPPSNLRIVP